MPSGGSIYGLVLGHVQHRLIVLCCIKLITAEKVDFEFTKGVGDNDVPLEALKISNEDKEWRKVASTSRQHGVYVRRTGIFRV